MAQADTMFCIYNYYVKPKRPNLGKIKLWIDICFHVAGALYYYAIALLNLCWNCLPQMKSVKAPRMKKNLCWNVFFPN